MFRVVLTNTFLFFCCHVAQSQTMSSHTLLGKWVLVDSTSKETYTFNFIDSQKVELLFNGNQLVAHYSMDVNDNKTRLVINLNDEKPQELIIMEKTADQIKLCLPKNYKRAFETMQSKNGKIGWGWDNPIIVWQKTN